jgi:hypothetical protein
MEERAFLVHLPKKDELPHKIISSAKSVAELSEVIATTFGLPRKITLSYYDPTFGEFIAFDSLSQAPPNPKVQVIQHDEVQLDSKREQDYCFTESNLSLVNVSYFYLHPLLVRKTKKLLNSILEN